MRCLTLAEELRRRGASVCFLTRPAPGDIIARIRDDKFDVEELDATIIAESGEFDWQRDLRASTAAMAGTSVGWLVVDHYALDQRWERGARAWAPRILVIDDLANRSHDADALLDANLLPDLEHRYDGLFAAGR